MWQKITVLDFKESYYSVTAEIYSERKYLLFPYIRLIYGSNPFLTLKQI
jgi:hypothetical protein